MHTKIKDNGRWWLWRSLVVIAMGLFYIVRELLAVFVMFALGFAAIAFVGACLIKKLLLEAHGDAPCRISISVRRCVGFRRLWRRGSGIRGNETLYCLISQRNEHYDARQREEGATAVRTVVPMRSWQRVCCSSKTSIVEGWRLRHMKVR